MKQRVAVLISGNGSNLQALIDASKNHEDYPAEISLVISNKPDAYGLKRAQKAKIATEVIEHDGYADRAAFDTALHEALIAHKIDLVCLAGFMRLLTKEFVNQWPNRMINIHPSLLPAFKGANAIRDALDYGVKITGCTVHYVIPEMDAGPIIHQEAINILENDTIYKLAERIHQAEHHIYPKALEDVARKLRDCV